MPVTALYAPDYPIITPRLRLRPFNRGDVDAVYSYRSREDVAHFLFDQPMNLAECANASIFFGFFISVFSLVLSVVLLLSGRVACRVRKDNTASNKAVQGTRAQRPRP